MRTSSVTFWLLHQMKLIRVLFPSVLLFCVVGEYGGSLSSTRVDIITTTSDCRMVNLRVDDAVLENCNARAENLGYVIFGANHTYILVCSLGRTDKQQALHAFASSPGFPQHMKASPVGDRSSLPQMLR